MRTGVGGEVVGDAGRAARGRGRAAGVRERTTERDVSSDERGGECGECERAGEAKGGAGAVFQGYEHARDVSKVFGDERVLAGNQQRGTGERERRVSRRDRVARAIRDVHV